MIFCYKYQGREVIITAVWFEVDIKVIGVRSLAPKALQKK